MQRRGYKDIVVYIDDFLIVTPTYEQCNEALHVLIRLLRKLGFCISWPKVVGLTQRITFLGVVIDTVASTLSLGADKLRKLDQELNAFWARKRATKQQLQRLAGLLNWACSVMRGGKFFLRRILDSISVHKHARHEIRLSYEFKRDLAWWRTYLHSFDGVMYYDEQAKVSVHMDACNTAAGGFWQGQWRYAVFQCDLPAAANLHINYKEVVAVVEAVKCWAPSWCGRTVVIHTDSTVAKCIIDKGRSKNKLINCMLGKMFWVCAKYNCKMYAIFVSGCVNIFADTVSRLHERGNIKQLASLLTNWFSGSQARAVSFSVSMSEEAFFFLMRRTKQAFFVACTDRKTLYVRGHVFAVNTQKTYASHMRS